MTARGGYCEALVGVTFAASNNEFQHEEKQIR